MEAVKQVGIDLGLKTFITLSTGEKIELPWWLKATEKEINKIDYQLRLGTISKWRKVELKKQLADKTDLFSNHFDHFIRLTAQRIISEFDFIGLESLNILAMIDANEMNNAQILKHTKWDKFIKYLKLYAQDTDKQIVFIDQYKPSSKRCCKCGYINRELQLSDRKWDCPQCKNHQDRDRGAAINVLYYAIEQQKSINNQSTLIQN